MSGDELLAILGDRGLIDRGHFEVPDGQHSDTWLDRLLLTEDPELAEPFLRRLAMLLKPFSLDRVTGASSRGLIVANQIALILGVRFHSLDFTQETPHVDPFAELNGERMGVVDDFVYRAEHFDSVVRAVRSKGAEVVALGALVAFPIRAVDLPVDKFITGCLIEAQLFPGASVPGWLSQIPVQKVGE